VHSALDLESSSSYSELRNEGLSEYRD